jgi:hypothetical protein
MNGADTTMSDSAEAIGRFRLVAPCAQPARPWRARRANAMRSGALPQRQRIHSRAVASRGDTPNGVSQLPGRAFSAREMRELRSLAQEAYSRELNEALRQLDLDFSAWKDSNIDAFQLSDSVHTFHQGPSRELYVDYMRLHPGILATRALARGILKREDVSDALFEKLSDRVAVHRELFEQPET